MSEKKSWFSIGKLISVALTLTLSVSVGAIFVTEVYDQRVNNEIMNTIARIDSALWGVAAIPETLKVGDAVVAAPSTLFIYTPPNTLFVPSPPSSTIVIHRETLTVFDTVRVEREKPKPMWWDDPRRLGRIW